MFWDAYACARRGYERNASESCQDNDIDEWCQTDPRWESIRSFRQVGSTIQVIYVENEGEDVRPMAKSITD